MEKSNLNKSFCEEMFRGELDVTEEPEKEKSQARQHCDWLHERHTRETGILQNVEGVLKKMESFCRTKKSMFISIREKLICRFVIEFTTGLTLRGAHDRSEGCPSL